MRILTTRELQALSNQMDLEQELHSQYERAAQTCQDERLQEQFQGLADQHRQNYVSLLGFLK